MKILQISVAKNSSKVAFCNKGRRGYFRRLVRLEATFGQKSSSKVATFTSFRFLDEALNCTGHNYVGHNYIGILSDVVGPGLGSRLEPWAGVDVVRPGLGRCSRPGTWPMW